MGISRGVSNWDYHSIYILPIICIIGDYIAIVLSEKIALSLCNVILGEYYSFHIPLLYFYLWIPLIYLFFIFYTGGHKRMIPFWETIKNIFYANFYSIVVAIFILYLVHRVDNISRAFILLFFILSFILLCIIKQIIVKIFNRLDIGKEPVIFIGAGDTATKIIKLFNENHCFGIRVVGLVDEDLRTDFLKENFTLLKGIDKAKEYIEKNKVKTVIIASPKMDKYKLIDMMKDIQPLVRNLLFVPNLIGTPVANLDVIRLYTANIPLLYLRNNLARRRNRIMKYIFDMTLTIVGTICISPILIVIAIWIYKDSPGPIIFKHMRVGKNGKEFLCYKFRSMCVDAKEKLEELLKNDPVARAEWEKDFKLKHDPRITKSGAFLRKTSLDELPQIFNVLKGEMSLVGPRPIIKAEMERYKEHIADYLMVKPGIAGMWQCSGRSDIDYAERVELDSWYVHNWSVWLDIMILWNTLKAVFAKKGAY